MKLAKLSLAAIVVASLSASAFAADSLAGAFKEGKVSGDLKVLYFAKTAKPSAGNVAKYTGATATRKSVHIFDFGVDLSYVTGNFNGFTAGITFQGNSSPWSNQQARAVYNGDMYGTGGQLSQSYVEYKNSGAFLKVGRQFISTPLVGGSGSRITKESFEGYVAGYNGLPKTSIVAAYVTKYQTRTDSNGGIGQFGTVGNGAWTIAVANKSVHGLLLQAAYAKVKKVKISKTDPVGDLKAWYVNAKYVASIASGTKVRVGANYYNTSTTVAKTSTSKDGNMYSLMLGANFNGLDGQIAYGKVSSSSSSTAGLGNGPGSLYNNTAEGMYFNDYSAGMKNTSIKVGYDLSKVGVVGAKVNAGYNKFSGVGTSYTVVGMGASYKFAGSLKGLSTTVKYASKSVSGGNTDPRFRFYAVYSF